MTLSILAAELLKVRKRWLPYILLAVLLLVTGMQVWLGGYVSWRTSGEYQLEQESLRLFVLPWALPGLLDTVQFWGGILTGVIAASMVATEHGWGTVRQALVRGQTRSGYLTAKLAGIATLGLIGIATAFLVGIVFSLLATALADQPVTFDAPGGPSAFDVALMVGRTIYATLPYVLLAFCLTVVSRSTTLGAAGILVYVIVEGIVTAILGGIGGSAGDWRVLFPGHNVVGLLAADRINGIPADSVAFRNNPAAADLPDPAAAALVLALYCALFLAIAFAVFQRRDLGTDGGGG